MKKFFLLSILILVININIKAQERYTYSGLNSDEVNLLLTNAKNQGISFSFAADMNSVKKEQMPVCPGQNSQRDAYVCAALIYAYSAELYTRLGNFKYNGQNISGAEMALKYAKMVKENLDNADKLCGSGAMGDSHPITIKIYPCK